MWSLGQDGGLLAAHKSPSLAALRSPLSPRPFSHLAFFGRMGDARGGWLRCSLDQQATAPPSYLNHLKNKTLTLDCGEATFCFEDQTTPPAGQKGRFAAVSC